MIASGLIGEPTAFVNLIGGAAVTRTLAWLWQGADFAAFFIAVEVIVAATLITGARRLDEI